VPKAQLPVTQLMLQELKQRTGYNKRAADVAAFNAAHTWRKRGLALMPSIYPIPAYMGDALVQVGASLIVGQSALEMTQRATPEHACLPTCY
jgi:xanthine dehydrogenase molybdopterin-binding subunit B